MELDRDSRQYIVDDEQRQRQQLFFDFNAVWEFQFKDESLYLNRRCRQLLGIVHDENLNLQQFLDIFDTEAASKLLRTIKQSSQSIGGFEFLHQVSTKEMRQFFIKGKRVNFANSPSRDYRILASIHELTELGRELSNLRQASTNKSEFLAHMSHELRTPLNAIMGVSELMGIIEPDDEKFSELLSTLKSSTEALHDLLNSLLDLSRIEQNRIQLENTSFALAPLFEEIHSIFVEEARSCGIELLLDNLATDSLHFIGDKARLRQVLINIVGNAVKFTPNGHVKILAQTIWHEEQQREQLLIQIEDSGIGIPDNAKEKLFSTFFRADNTAGIKGSGLGLVIARNFVTMMKGELTIQSQEGKGTRVSITLPLERSLDPGPLTTSTSAHPGQVYGKKILLVEDSKTNVLVTTKLLESFGIDVDVACNGKEGIEKMRQNQYDLVLMDVNMPVMGGLDATVQWRKWENTHRINKLPIIGLTAHALSGDKDRCLDAGMDDYLTKPITLDSLGNKLEKFFT